MPDIKIKRYADKENLKKLMKYSKDTFATKTELASKANDSDVAHKSGDETIAGTKTFSEPIVGSVTGSSGSCTGNAVTATTAGAVSTTVADGSSKDLVYASMASNDAFRIRCGGGDDNGYIEIATSDNGNEPIYVRQYNFDDGAPGAFNTVVRTLTLLDENGNTQLPGTVTAPTFSGNLNGNAATATKLQTTRSINGTNFDGSGNITTAKWGTARNISISDGTNTGSAVSVNGSGNVTLKLPSTINANVVGYLTGNISGSSGSCTGNAASANIATKATQDSDGNKITTTYSKNGHTHDDRYYTENEVNNLLNGKANTSGTYSNLTVGNAGSATKAANADHATKATQDAAGNTITTTYATKAENNTKADNSKVVHKSGDETIAGTKTFSNGVLLTNSNALMAQTGGYTLVLRNDGSNTYLLMSDKGGVPGTWSSARPFVINNSTGVCDINGNAATATTATTATNAGYANWLRTSSHSDHLFHTEWDGGYFWTYVTAGNGAYRAVRVARSDSSGYADTAAKLVQWYAAYPDGAEAHNAMWGGRDITAAFNNGTVSANIANGTFRDIFPGDYITKQVTISGTAHTVNWVIADCDYWINKGDQGSGITAHHVVIVPQTPIFNARMNGTNNTVGGYADSRMYTETIPACATGIVSAFRGDHILTFRDLITNTVYNDVASRGYCRWTGASAEGVWASVQCNLMSEAMVYGAPHFSSSGFDDEIATRQMSAFRLSERLINYDHQWWWLRDVVSSSSFASVIGDGRARTLDASFVVGVRPFALLR